MRRRSVGQALACWAGMCVPLLFLTACIPKSDREVVIYSALDREFSEPILEDYEGETGVAVLPKYDVESTKTVGLVTALIAEKNRPRCDVFWNNEILHTMRLEQMGLLDVYTSPVAKDFPADYVSSDGHWHGLAARARVLIINTDLIPDEDEWPRSIQDLADEKWSGKAAIAKPLFGTTATHAAVLFSHWGPSAAEQYFRDVKRHAGVLSGNKQVAIAVARGDYAFGITDTDDAIIELERGAPVAIVFPDQTDDQMGTLFIPNSLCIMKDCKNPEEARRLVDYLLSPQVESRLAKGPSAQFPLNPNVDEESRAQSGDDVRWMEVDFRDAAEQWDTAAEFLRDLFQTAE